MKIKTHLGAISVGILWGVARLITDSVQVNTATSLYIWMFTGFLMGIITVKTWN